MKNVDIEPLEQKYQDLYDRAARSGKKALAELLRIVLRDIERLQEKDVLVLGERYPAHEYKFAMWRQSYMNREDGGEISVSTEGHDEFAILRDDPEEEDLPDE